MAVACSGENMTNSTVPGTSTSSTREGDTPTTCEDNTSYVAEDVCQSPRLTYSSSATHRSWHGMLLQSQSSHEPREKLNCDCSLIVLRVSVRDLAKIHVFVLYARYVVVLYSTRTVLYDELARKNKVSKFPPFSIRSLILRHCIIHFL